MVSAIRDISSIIVHCSYTKPDMDWGASDIRRIHVDENGWDDIGYHVVIRRDGVAEGGRPFEVAGSHAAGYNKNSIGICLIGGMDENNKPACNFTFAQYLKLAEQLKTFMAAFEINRDDIIGHSEVSAKDCPCFDVNEFVRSM